MDDPQRVVLGGLGVGLMVGAITWTGAVSITSDHSLALRILPPSIMFVVGAILVIWALKSTNSRRTVLGRAIKEGNRMLQMPSNGNLWLAWQNKTDERLREHVGIPEAHRFVYPATTEDGISGRAKAQVAYLESLRKRRSG
jgi:hypothetical protein